MRRGRVGRPRSLVDGGLRLEGIGEERVAPLDEGVHIADQRHTAPLVPKIDPSLGRVPRDDIRRSYRKPQEVIRSPRRTQEIPGNPKNS